MDIELGEFVVANVRIELLCTANFPYRGSRLISRRLAEQDKRTRQMRLRKSRVDSVSAAYFVFRKRDPLLLFIWNDVDGVKGVRVGELRVRQAHSSGRPQAHS